MKIAAELLIIASVGVGAIYHEMPSVVEVSIQLALLGCLGATFYNCMLNKEKRTLLLAEAQERTYLNSILTKIDQGQEVDFSLVKRAQRACTEAEEAYEVFHGRSRSSALASIAKFDRAAIKQAKQNK